MNVSGIDYESIVDGQGVRTAIFISGCEHDCKGCHNKDAQDFGFGEPFTEALQAEVLRNIKERPYVSGITLTGGDPMFSASELIPFVQKYKDEIGGNVWVYSGFKLEDIEKNEHMAELLSLADVLVDGPFVEELREMNLMYRGSSNQRVIDLKEGVVLYGN